MKIYIIELSKYIKAKIFYTILLTLAFFTAGYAQKPDNAKLDQFFERLAEKNKAMGNMIIAKGGNILYTNSIGYSQINGTAKKPLTETTKFRVGSVTKMFTAVVLFQLIEEGELMLNDHLNKFFPQIPNAAGITIMQILAHRSGIQDVLDIQEFRIHRFEPITKDILLAIIAKGTPDFEPGTKYKYSNSGYILLALIIEKLTGKTYSEVLDERINLKIGLKGTYAGNGNIDMAKNESFSYKYTFDWEKQAETHISLLFGSGNLISTSTDLSKFIQALFDLKLISLESLHQMMHNKFGMETFTYNGKTGYGHTGGIDNFGSWLVYIPEEKLAVAYTTNAKVYPIARIVDGIFDIYYNKPFAIPSFDTIEVSPIVLDKYVGVYSISGVPVKFIVTRDDATLLIQMTGQSVIPLEAITENRFRIESAGIEFEFDALKNQMVQIRGGREKVFTIEN